MHICGTIHLRCALLNVQRLSSRRVNKLNTKELTTVFDTHDIVLLTETWAHSYSQLSYNGFECFVLNRTELLKSSKRSSGGIAVYVRNNYVRNSLRITFSTVRYFCVFVINIKNDFKELNIIRT